MKKQQRPNITENKYCSCPLGIWLHESGVLGASPDGLITMPPGLTADTYIVYHSTESAQAVPDIVEVKCPYTARLMTVLDAATTLKDFFLGLYFIVTNLIFYVFSKSSLINYNVSSIEFYCKTGEETSQMHFIKTHSVRLLMRETI